MEHERAQELLSDYQEGTLQEDLLADFESHLEACQDCRADLEMLGQAMRMVQRLPRVQAPDHFARRVHRRARKAGLIGRKRLRSRLQSPQMFTFTSIMLMAAVGALILFVLVVQQQIELLVLPPGPALVELHGPEEADALAELTWRHGGTIRVNERDIPAPGPLPPSGNLELTIPATAFEAFSADLAEAGPVLVQDGPRPTADEHGQVHLRVLRPGISDAGSSDSSSR